MNIGDETGDESGADSAGNTVDNGDVVFVEEGRRPTRSCVPVNLNEDVLLRKAVQTSLEELIEADRGDRAVERPRHAASRGAAVASNADTDAVKPASKFECAKNFECDWGRTELVRTPVSLWSADEVAAAGIDQRAADFVRQAVSKVTSDVAAAVARAQLVKEGVVVGAAPEIVPTLLLLEGPPGCGKTEIAKTLISVLATSETLKPYLWKLLAVSAGSLTPKWKGADISEVDACFYAACHKGETGTEPFVGISVIFMDEMGSFAVKDDDPSDNAMRRHVTEVLSRVLPLHFGGAVVVIGCINDSNDVHGAVMSRANVLTFKRPDMARYRVLYTNILKKQCAALVGAVGENPDFASVIGTLIDDQVLAQVDRLGGICGTDIRRLVQAVQWAVSEKRSVAATASSDSGTPAGQSPGAAAVAPERSNAVVLNDIFSRAVAVTRALATSGPSMDVRAAVADVLPTSAGLANGLAQICVACLASDEYSRTLSV
jgi:hypothetical protein